MIVDYWIVRRGNLHVPSLYTKDPDAPYTYYHGWNFRAAAAWIAGVAFTIHGIAGNLNPDSVNDASKNMYRLGFLLSLLMGAAVYYVACLIWPLPVYPDTTRDGSMMFEAMADSEGFLAGESPDTITLRGVICAVSQPRDQDSSGPKDSAEKSVSEKCSV
jgi:NCS1 family nucleobase:cation symporter-1